MNEERQPVVLPLPTLREPWLCASIRARQDEALEIEEVQELAEAETLIRRIAFGDADRQNGGAGSSAFCGRLG